MTAHDEAAYIIGQYIDAYNGLDAIPGDVLVRYAIERGALTPVTVSHPKGTWGDWALYDTNAFDHATETVPATKTTMPSDSLTELPSDTTLYRVTS